MFLFIQSYFLIYSYLSDVGTHGKFQHQNNCHNWPLHWRSQCLSMCSLVTVLPPPQIFLHLCVSLMHHFWFTNAREWLFLPCHSQTKMGWKLLSCGLKAWYNAKAAFCTHNPLHCSAKLPASVLATVHKCSRFWEADRSSFWPAARVVQRCDELLGCSHTRWRRVYTNFVSTIWELPFCFIRRSSVCG